MKEMKVVLNKIKAFKMKVYEEKERPSLTPSPPVGALCPSLRVERGGGQLADIGVSQERAMQTKKQAK